MDYRKYLTARVGFDLYRVVAAFELEGVGAGTGSSALLLHGTRAGLTEVVQRAAREVGTPVSTRGVGLHPDPEIWPLPSLDVPSATISWSGCHHLAGLPTDTAENIDRDKIGQTGRMVSLSLMVLATDPAYQ